MEVRNAQRKAAQSLSKTGTHRLVVRHKGVPASTAICTSGGSQGIQALGGKEKGGGGGGVSILLN